MIVIRALCTRKQKFFFHLMNSFDLVQYTNYFRWEATLEKTYEIKHRKGLVFFVLFCFTFLKLLLTLKQFILKRQTCWQTTFHVKQIFPFRSKKRLFSMKKISSYFFGPTFSLDLKLFILTINRKFPPEKRKKKKQYSAHMAYPQECICHNTL